MQGVLGCSVGPVLVAALPRQCRGTESLCLFVALGLMEGEELTWELGLGLSLDVVSLTLVAALFF